MDRTLKDIEYDLELAKKELAHLQEKEKTIQNRIDKYEDELCKFKINNGYMKDISELQKYKNRDISYIELIVDIQNSINEQNKITLIPMICGRVWHTLKIDIDGHFYARSCRFHSINYHENNGYGYETMQLRKPYNILGYTDLVLKE